MVAVFFWFVILAGACLCISPILRESAMISKDRVYKACSSSLLFSQLSPAFRVRISSRLSFSLALSFLVRCELFTWTPTFSFCLFSGDWATPQKSSLLSHAQHKALGKHFSSKYYQSYFLEASNVFCVFQFFIKQLFYFVLFSFAICGRHAF